jgi:hypothetical protein
LALEVVFEHSLVEHIVLDLLSGKDLVIDSDVDDLALESSGVAP